MSSRSRGLREILPVSPGGGLVVEGAGLEASVQDADEAVGEPSQGVVVFDFAGAELVVEGPGTRGRGQRGERLGIEGIDEAVVVDEPGRDDLLLARRTGDRAGRGVVPPRLPVTVAGRVVAELAEHPGTEDRAHPRLGQVDLSVRVPAKMLPHLTLQD